MAAKRGRPPKAAKLDENPTPTPAEEAKPKRKLKPKETTAIQVRRDLADRLKAIGEKKGMNFVTFTNLLIESILDNMDIEVQSPSVKLKPGK